MKTLEVTADEALALAVPGDVLGVLEGYSGPLLAGDPLTSAMAVDGVVVAWTDALLFNESAPICPEDAPKMLPLRSFLIRAHLVEWLGRGERCPLCFGRGKYEDALPSEPLLICWKCKGSGKDKDRPPRDLYWALKPKHLGGPSEWVACAVVYASVLRVAAGMAPPKDGFGPWEFDTARDRCGRSYRGPHPMCPADKGMSWWGRPNCDEEDAKALARGDYLLDVYPVRGPVLRVKIPSTPPAQR